MINLQDCPTVCAGSEPDWTPAAAAALGHAAKLAHHMLAGRRQDSTAATAAAPESALRLATVLMQTGAGSSDSWRTAALRPFLTGIVAGLCRQSPNPGDCRYDAAVVTPKTGTNSALQWHESEDKSGRLDLLL